MIIIATGCLSDKIATITLTVCISSNNNNNRETGQKHAQLAADTAKEARKHRDTKNTHTKIVADNTKIYTRPNGDKPIKLRRCAFFLSIIRVCARKLQSLLVLVFTCTRMTRLWWEGSNSWLVPSGQTLGWLSVVDHGFLAVTEPVFNNQWYYLCYARKQMLNILIPWS